MIYNFRSFVNKKIKLKKRSTKYASSLLAPRVGFEPTTNSLTASCATAALPGNNQLAIYNYKLTINRKSKLPLGSYAGII